MKTSAYGIELSELTCVGDWIGARTVLGPTAQPHMPCGSMVPRGWPVRCQIAFQTCCPGLGHVNDLFHHVLQRLLHYTRDLSESELLELLYVAEGDEVLSAFDPSPDPRR